MIKELAATILLTAAPLKAAESTEPTTAYSWIEFANDQTIPLIPQNKSLMMYEENNTIKYAIYNGTMSPYYDEANYLMSHLYNSTYANAYTRYIGFIYHYTAYDNIICLSTDYDGILSYSTYELTEYTIPDTNYHFNFNNLTNTQRSYTYYGSGYSTRFSVSDEYPEYWSEYNHIQAFSEVYTISGENITFNRHILKATNMTSDRFCVHKNEQYRMGYNNGYANGKSAGRVEGLDEGYTRGYDDGVEAASATTENGVFSIFTGAFTSVSKFLGFQIAPNITLGLLFSVPIVVGIIFVIIKFIKG